MLSLLCFINAFLYISSFVRKIWISEIHIYIARFEPRDDAKFSKEKGDFQEKFSRTHAIVRKPKKREIEGDIAAFGTVARRRIASRRMGRGAY